MLRVRTVDEPEEFVAGGGGTEEGAQHGGCDHAAVLFFDAAHHHAEVMAFHNDTDAFRIDLFFYVGSDLLREALLYLETACEAIDKTCQLADAKDFASRDVADVATAVERQHVVFAKAVDFDVLHDDHVVAFFVEDGVADDVVWIDAIATKEEVVGLCDAFGRFAEPFTFGVFADVDEELMNQFGSFHE